MHLRFEEVHHVNGKRTFLLWSIKKNEHRGWVNYSKPQKRYIFTPCANSRFDLLCLLEIVKKIDELDKSDN